MGNRFAFGLLGSVKFKVLRYRLSELTVPRDSAPFAIRNCSAMKGSTAPAKPLARAISSRLTVRTELSAAV